MWNYVWKSKSLYAKVWLVGAAGVQAALAFIASLDPAPELFGGYGKWTNREAMVLFSMGLLLLSALAMHGLDKPKQGWGFIFVFRRSNAFREPNEQRFVPAVLTVESIRAAMTTVLLAALLDNRKNFLPPELQAGAPPESKAGAVEGILNGIMFAHPRAVFFSLVIAVLAFSLVTTMAALLCYEYATRFTWRNDGPKSNLLQKAFHFGVWGFYCLMWSLAVIPALIDYYLGFLSIFVVFTIMWLYYFFPANEMDLPSTSFTVFGEIREVETLTPAGPGYLMRLRCIYGDRTWHWRKGLALIKLENGVVRDAELHWQEADGSGKKELKVRRFLKESESASAGAGESTSFAVCLRNEFNPASLEPHKLYQTKSDPDATETGYVQVIDESGDEYLHPASFFQAVSLPDEVKEHLVSSV